MFGCLTAACCSPKSSPKDQIIEPDYEDYSDYEDSENSKLVKENGGVHDQPDESATNLSLQYKIARVTTQFFVSVCFGAFSELIGPVLPELMAQTNTGLETMAQAISMRGGGHAFGGIIGGVTVDRWSRYLDLLIALNILLYIMAGVWSAYIKRIVLLFIVFFLQGSFESWLSLAAYRIVMKTWRENSAIPMHALIIGYGLGSIVVPQLVTPFLDKRFSANGRLLATATNISTCAEATMRNQSAALHDVDELEPEYPAKFVKAYWIVAQVSFVLAVFFVIHYVHSKLTGTRIDPPKKTGHQSMKNTLSIRNCSTDHPKYAAALITGLFFFYFSAFAIVRVFTKLIFSYARNGPCLSVQMSTAIESTYFVSLTAGRLVALFVTMVLHMKYILMLEVIGVLLSTLLLYFLHDDITVLWVAISSLGICSGPLIPSVFAWANRYIDLTAAAQMSPSMGAAAGELVIMTAVGYSFQNYGAYTIWTYQLALAGSLCVLTIAMQLIANAHGDRFGEHEPKVTVRWSC